MIRKKIALLGAAIVMALTSAAFGGQDGYMIKTAWNRHERGIKGSFSCLAGGIAHKACIDAMVDIVSAEVDLISRGVPHDDERLVARQLSSTEAPRLAQDAYRIFLTQFHRKTGWKPSRQALYGDKYFKLSHEDREHSFKLTPQ